MLLLPLGRCDLVLGVQWLSTLVIIKWDFGWLRMEFEYEGKVHILKGLKAGKAMLNLCMLHLLPELVQLWGLEGRSTDQPIEELLEAYKDIFKESAELPPSRGAFDHGIPLKACTSPINPSLIDIL